MKVNFDKKPGSLFTVKFGRMTHGELKTLLNAIKDYSEGSGVAKDMSFMLVGKKNETACG